MAMVLPYFKHDSIVNRLTMMTGKINCQTGKAILLPVEFSRIPSNFKR